MRRKSGFRESHRGAHDYIEIGGRYLGVTYMEIEEGEQVSPPSDGRHRGYFIDGSLWDKPIVGPRSLSIEQWRDGPRDADGLKRVTVSINEEPCACEACEGRRKVFERPLTADEQNSITRLLDLIASSLTLGMIGPKNTDPTGDICPPETRDMTNALLTQSIKAVEHMLPWRGIPPSSMLDFQNRVKCIASIKTNPEGLNNVFGIQDDDTGGAECSWRQN